MKIQVIEKSNNRSTTYTREINNKSTKYKGVYLKKDRVNKPYAVRGCYLNKSIHVGHFENPELAAKVYDLYAKEFIPNPQLNEDLYPELNEVVVPSEVLKELKERFIIIKINMNTIKNS